MKLLMIMVPSECLEDLEKVVKEHDVQAYTELPNVPGAGRTGGRLGTRAYPGTSSILLTVLSDECTERLTAAIRKFCTKPENCDQVRVFALPAEQLV